MGCKISLTIEDKKKIWEMHKNGFNQKKISLLACCSTSTICRITKKQKNDEFITGHKKGAGRHRVTNELEEQVLGRII